MRLAEFLCLKCHFTYKAKPGPTSCPNCGHLYIKWLNHKEIEKDMATLKEKGINKC